MADRGDNNYDVIVIRGGPSGAILGSLLAMNGHRALILEAIHPRDHVGESITPSTNPIFKHIGFLSKIRGGSRPTIPTSSISCRDPGGS